MSFINGSVLVNGHFSNDNPNTGIVIGDVKIDESIEVSFKVKVNKMPHDGQIKNKARVDYTYCIDKNKPCKSGFDYSCESIVKVEKVEIEILKMADKEAVVSGSTLTYTIIINNKSSVMLINAIIKDKLPKSTQYIDSSLYINGQLSPEQNITDGVRIDALGPRQSSRISFSVIIL